MTNTQSTIVISNQMSKVECKFI